MKSSGRSGIGAPAKSDYTRAARGGNWFTGRSLKVFELSNFNNSLKSAASAIAIECPPQAFECLQPLDHRTGQPVLKRIVRVRQAHHGKMRRSSLGSSINSSGLLPISLF
jgi:hypothetical protein